MRKTMLCVVAMATALSAQSFYIPDPNPGGVALNVYPFGNNDMRYQALVRANELNNTPALIVGFGLLPGATGVREFTSVTMKMAHLSSSTLSTTFDQNLAAGAVTTMDATNWSWYLESNVWTDVDLQVPFLFNGVDNLVVEFTVRGGTGAGGGMYRQGTNQRVYQTGYTGQPTGSTDSAAFKMRLITGDASLGRFGRGCAASNNLTPELSFGGSSRIGSSLDHLLSNSMANTPAFLGLGFWLGTPFPLDMGQFGFPGCTLYFPHSAVQVAITDPSGNGRFTSPIPNNAVFVGTFFHAQWFPLDLGTGGISSTNYGRILVGN